MTILCFKINMEFDFLGCLILVCAPKCIFFLMYVRYSAEIYNSIYSVNYLQGCILNE